MSEYQYYEFLAIDRPLTEREMGELRAVITATRFTWPLTRKVPTLPALPTAKPLGATPL